MARSEAREDLPARLRGARRYADFLREELRGAAALPMSGVCSARGVPDCAADEPRLWARSGAMALTGASVPRLSVGAPASCAEGALEAVRALAGRPAALAGLSGAALLGERAAALGLRRQGSVSPGGSCRLLPASDGTLALNLARPEDVSLLPAWLECDEIRTEDDPWISVREIVGRRPAPALEQRGRLMGLPVAAVPEHTPSVPWLRVTPFGDVLRPPGRRPRVIDLSSLWAGPLCTHLLQRCGAEVWKVESSKRPDGARRGERSFYDLLNGHKRSVSLDLETEGGRRQLAALLAGADIVVESSRPRALRQLGICAESLLGKRPGRVWLCLTGHGREAPGGDWVAFGDDAAAGAGLLARAEHTPAEGSGSRPDSPCFCGDAIADPLAGLHAAAAVLAFWQCGRSALLDVPLSGVAARAVAASGSGREAPVSVRVGARGGVFELVCGDAVESVASPRMRRPEGVAPALGRDTDHAFRELALPC